MCRSWGPRAVRLFFTNFLQRMWKKSCQKSRKPFKKGRGLSSIFSSFAGGGSNRRWLHHFRHRFFILLSLKKQQLLSILSSQRVTSLRTPFSGLERLLERLPLEMGPPADPRATSGSWSGSTGLRSADHRWSPTYLLFLGRAFSPNPWPLLGGRSAAGGWIRPRRSVDPKRGQIIIVSLIRIECWLKPASGLWLVCQASLLSRLELYDTYQGMTLVWLIFGIH